MKEKQLNNEISKKVVKGSEAGDVANKNLKVDVRVVKC